MQCKTSIVQNMEVRKMLTESLMLTETIVSLFAYGQQCGTNSVVISNDSSEPAAGGSLLASLCEDAEIPA